MNPQQIENPVERQPNHNLSDTLITNSNGNSPPGSENAPSSCELTRKFSLTIDSGGDQLATPQKNKGDALSIPREVISSSLSSSTLQLERSGPVIAGTYHGIPAYLVTLQLTLDVPGNDSRSWLSRIQTASVSVVTEDAPLGGEDKTKPTSRWDRRPTARQLQSEPAHPAIVKAFPEHQGWEGPVSAAKVTSSKEIGMKVGWDELGITGRSREDRVWDDLGALRVTTQRVGNERNCLIIRMIEDPVTKAGVLPHLTVPMILTHHNRRFKMRATVNAKFGFWRGALSELVPVLGREDDPLFFDPTVLQRTVKKGKLGTSGVKIVEWGGDLECVNLRKYSSLVKEGKST